MGVEDQGVTHTPPSPLAALCATLNAVRAYTLYSQTAAEAGKWDDADRWLGEAAFEMLELHELIERMKVQPASEDPLIPRPHPGLGAVPRPNFSDYVDDESLF